jgi:hypothetical protein
MTTHGKGTFTLTGFDEQTAEEFGDGTKLTRARITQTMDGDLDGESTSDLYMYYRADGTAEFMGFQRFVGRIGERSGSLVLQSTGGYDGSVARTTSTVVPGAGSGDLAALRGCAASAAPQGSTGEYTIDYDVE